MTLLVTSAALLLCAQLLIRVGGIHEVALGMHVQKMEDQFDSYVRALDSLEKLDVQLTRWVQAMENFAKYEQRQVARLDGLVAESKSPHELVKMRDQRIASLQKLAREIEHARSIRDRGTSAFL